ncbi:hypothetical protein R6Q59_023701 [Mikania micrantha]
MSTVSTPLEMGATTATSAATFATSSLTRSRATPARFSTAPLTSSIATTVVFTDASSVPSITRSDPYTMIALVADQLSTLNSLVLRLIEKNHEQDQTMSQLTQRVSEQDALLLQAADQRADLRARSADLEERLLKSMDEHNQLALTAEQVESLKDSTPRVEGSEPVSDDSDKEDEDEDEEEEEEEEEEESDEEKVDYDSNDEDDDSGDDDDGIGSGSASSSSSGEPTPPIEIRTKTRHDRAAKLPQSQAKEPKSTEEVDDMPVRRLLDEKLMMILDAQGIIQHSISYDKEEGEIIHCLSKEQIAELLRLNPDEVDQDHDIVSISDLLTPEAFDDIDEVILEDITEEESTKYTLAKEELLAFADLFGLHT